MKNNKLIMGYQTIEMIVFIVALIIAIIVCIRVDRFAEEFIANSNNSFPVIIVEALVYGLIKISKFFAVLTLSLPLLIIGIIGITINYDTISAIINYIVVVVSGGYSIGFVLYVIINSLSSGSISSFDPTEYIQLIDFAFRCGFGLI